MGATQQFQPRITTTQFGDGYQARFRNGLNTNPRTWSVTFTNADVDSQQIMQFLGDRGGFEAFTWTDPRGKTGDFVCAQWSDKREGPGVISVTAEFKEVFEP